MQAISPTPTPEDIWSVATFLSEFGIQGALILLTLVVSGLSYRSQSRAGIREAIEHLDPRNVSYKTYDPEEDQSSRSASRKSTWNVQVKAGLAKTSFVRREAKILFYFNSITDGADRVVGHSVPPYHIKIPKHFDTVPLDQRVLEHQNITNINRDENKLEIVCSSVNPVVCREAASHVLDELDDSRDNPIEQQEFLPRQRRTR